MRRALAEARLPEGYAARIEGQFQAQEEARRIIALLSLVSLVGLHAR